MSAWMGQARSQVRSRLPRIAENAVERARLTVVPRRRPQAPRVPFIILVSMVLLGGVVGLLLFNTHMQQASFRATALETRADALHAKEQQLRMELDKLRDPQRVAVRAERLGMVPMTNPAFIELGTGTVLGDAIPATRDDAVRLDPLPPRRPSSSLPPVVAAPVEPVQALAAQEAAQRAGQRAGQRADRQGTSKQGTSKQGTNKQGTNKQGTNKQD